MISSWQKVPPAFQLGNIWGRVRCIGACLRFEWIENTVESKTGARKLESLTQSCVTDKLPFSFAASAVIAMAIYPGNFNIPVVWTSVEQLS